VQRALYLPAGMNVGVFPIPSTLGVLGEGQADSVLQVLIQLHRVPGVPQNARERPSRLRQRYTGSHRLEGDLPQTAPDTAMSSGNPYRLDGCPLPLDCGPVFPVDGAAPVDGVLPRPDWPLRPSVEDAAPPLF